MSSGVEYKENFKQYEQKVLNQMKTGMSDIARDVKGSAKGAAPHFKGQLEKGINYKTKASADSIEIVLDVSAKGSNGYDYAPFIHSGSYSLGTKSRSKGSGVSGITGNSYSVGKEFLARPVKDGASGYYKHLEKLFKGVRV